MNIEQYLIELVKKYKELSLSSFSKESFDNGLVEILDNLVVKGKLNARSSNQNIIYS